MTHSIRPSFENTAYNILTAAGYVPVLSILTGTMQVIGSTALAIAGVVKALFHQIQVFHYSRLYSSSKGEPQQQKLTYHKNERSNSLSFALFMTQRIGRGLIEAIPVAGNLGCYVYDNHREKEALRAAINRKEDELEALKRDIKPQEKLREPKSEDLNLLAGNQQESAFENLNEEDKKKAIQKGYILLKKSHSSVALQNQEKPFLLGIIDRLYLRKEGLKTEGSKKDKQIQSLEEKIKNRTPFSDDLRNKSYRLNTLEKFKKEQSPLFNQKEYQELKEELAPIIPPYAKGTPQKITNKNNKK
ncbi:MAG: hypothetical protein QRY74_01915 [Chlamydia sp.]